jgi:hypothetical protein
MVESTFTDPPLRGCVGRYADSCVREVECVEYRMVDTSKHKNIGCYIPPIGILSKFQGHKSSAVTGKILRDATRINFGI